MPGETDVMNMGLSKIGQQPITSRTQGTTTSNAVDDIYDDLRDDLLRAHPWNFATKRVKLARSSTTPTYEYDYGYPLPADWLRTISVHDNDAGSGTLDSRTEILNGQIAIITSAEAVYLRYVYRVTDPNLMTADFVTALALAIGRDLAVIIASSNTLEDQLNKRFEKKIAQARSSDAIGAPPERRPVGSWVKSRGGFRRDDFLND